MRAKHWHLKNGIDNLDYIENCVSLVKRKEELKDELNKKYDYKNKKVVGEDVKIEDA